MTIFRNCTWLFDGLPLMSMVKAGVQPKQRLVSLLLRCFQRRACLLKAVEFHVAGFR